MNRTEREEADTLISAAQTRGNSAKVIEGLTNVHLLHDMPNLFITQEDFASLLAWIGTGCMMMEVVVESALQPMHCINVPPNGGMHGIEMLLATTVSSFRVVVGRVVVVTESLEEEPFRRFVARLLANICVLRSTTSTAYAHQ